MKKISAKKPEVGPICDRHNLPQSFEVQSIQIHNNYLSMSVASSVITLEGPTSIANAETNQFPDCKKRVLTFGKTKAQSTTESSESIELMEAGAADRASA